MLGSSPEPLCAAYDLAMLDLDGVVYVGADAVPGAADRIAAARAAGMRCAFITNNASRPPADVAAHLTELGVPAQADDVVTSAQAACRLLLDRLGPRRRWRCWADPGSRSRSGRRVWRRSRSATRAAQALVSGYGPDVLWRDVMRAAVRCPRRAVVGGQQHRLHDPHRLRRGPGARDAGAEPQRVLGCPTGGGGQAVATAARRDGATGGRRSAADGGRPARHRHRGCHERRRRSLLVLTGVTGLAELVARRPGGAADVPRHRARRVCWSPTERRSPSTRDARRAGGGSPSYDGSARGDRRGCGRRLVAGRRGRCLGHRDRTGAVADIGDLVAPPT